MDCTENDLSLNSCECGGEQDQGFGADQPVPPTIVNCTVARMAWMRSRAGARGLSAPPMPLGPRPFSSASSEGDFFDFWEKFRPAASRLSASRPERRSLHPFASRRAVRSRTRTRRVGRSLGLDPDRCMIAAHRGPMKAGRGPCLDFWRHGPRRKKSRFRDHPAPGPPSLAFRRLGGRARCAPVRVFAPRGVVGHRPTCVARSGCLCGSYCPCYGYDPGGEQRDDQN